RISVLDRKADQEAGGNSLAPAHRDEQRMEIGAVPALVLAGVAGIAAAPPGPALVVAHRPGDVVVEGADLRRAGVGATALLLGERANDARQRDQLVGRLVE